MHLFPVLAAPRLDPMHGPPRTQIDCRSGDPDHDLPGEARAIAGYPASGVCLASCYVYHASGCSPPRAPLSYIHASREQRRSWAQRTGSPAHPLRLPRNPSPPGLPDREPSSPGRLTCCLLVPSGRLTCFLPVPSGRLTCCLPVPSGRLTCCLPVPSGRLIDLLLSCSAASQQGYVQPNLELRLPNGSYAATTCPADPCTSATSCLGNQTYWCAAVAGGS